MIVFHTGTQEEAERELAPFKEWGSPMVVNVGPMPYPVMNTILDDGFPTGSLNYWLSSFTSGMPDELIDIAAERFAAVPSTMTTILFEHFHGAVTRVGVERHGRAAPRGGLEPRAPVGLDGPRRHREEHRAGRSDTHAAFAEHLTEAPLAQLPRRRPGRRRDPRRLRPELRPARRGEARRTTRATSSRQNHNIVP